MPLDFSRAWHLGIGRFLVLAFIGTALGVWWQAVPECLLVLCCIYLFYFFIKVRQLHAWLNGHSLLPPPKIKDGTWAELYDLLIKRQRDARLNKRHLIRRLRAFREAAAALPDATVVLDRTLHIIWFNPAANDLLGLKYPQDIGGYFGNLVRASNVVEWLNAASAAHDGTTAEPLQNVPAPRDENTRLSLHLIRYSPDQILLVARDVTNLMRLEQVRRDFVANVSHELRTPLTVVHGYLDLLDPEQVPEWDPVLRELRVQSQRMAQIVEDLLTLSRLEANGGLVEERVNLHSMLVTLRREAEALSQGKHRILIEEHGNHDLQGSLKELHSAFSNLVSNAVRYTPAGGTITIRWNSGEAGAAFSVSDTGNGIAPQYIPRITERFYRVSTSRSRETGGTGLGLSIVKHVLGLHQARLEIRSEVGVGSTFTCVFAAEHLLASEG